ncbi:nucleotide exchange factor SIL1 isoform X2 [Dermochelys coriacea]|uniref:nucleotide exchange factor SIL1 isoform X2 n=1 Tax=Dermochelys coriacea TaxID=27794 RepID=UPI001CA969ED|nr:nucleotide exchange factor SIL1 isoform X2 [Dermochelys coriacea]
MRIFASNSQSLMLVSAKEGEMLSKPLGCKGRVPVQMCVVFLGRGCARLTAMSHCIGLLSIASKLNLLVLLLSALCFCSCLSDRIPEFALTKIEDSDLKEENGKESVAEDDLDPEDLEVFYPTYQWQTVRPGQAVPAGLHVRLNLQTGEREARLPDNKNEKSDMKDQEKRKRLDEMHINSNSFTSQELKEALAKMKEKEKTESTMEQKANLEDVRQRFRPIEELKKEFEELNMKIETDFEIMVKLINKFNSSTSTLDEKVAALYDLEYYVHQVDNAKDFLSLGGLQLVINGVNSTEPVLKEHAAFVLGAALSSNPKVQVEAIEGGALQKLLVILATEQPLAVKKKALFALSSMLRHFPYAQLQFLKLGGLQVLRNLFKEKGMESLYIRVVTLLYDLILEKMLLEDSENKEDQMKEKVQQYKQVNLVPAVVEQGWCVIISNLLALPEHDTREKVLKTVRILMAACRDGYQGDYALSTTLSMLRTEYEELAAEEQREGDKDGYFKELLSSINTIIQELRSGYL